MAEFSLKDVVNALQTLTDEQTKELFVQLGVKLHALDTIESQHKGASRKLYAAQSWLDTDLEASWEKIVAGLKQIRMIVLAERVASQHGLGTPTSVTDNMTSDPVSPPVPTQVSDVTQSPVTTESAPTDPVQPSVPAVSPTHPLTSNTDRVQQVKADIEQLQDSFAGVMSKTRLALCKKESDNPEFLDDFRDYLLFLPLSKRATHAKFFRESEDDILEARNIRKLLAILGRHCNYMNYEIMLQLIKKFCEALKKRMFDYCESLKSFEMATTIDIFLSAISACGDLLQAFTQMAMKINKPASVCTLHEVRKLKETLAEKAALPLYSTYIESVGVSSVLVVLRFHPDCIGWLLGAMTPDFLHAHCVTEVSVDGNPLTIQQEDKQKMITVDEEPAHHVVECAPSSSTSDQITVEPAHQVHVPPPQISDQISEEEEPAHEDVECAQISHQISADEELARQLQFELDFMPDAEEGDIDVSSLLHEEYARQLQCKLDRDDVTCQGDESRLLLYASGAGDVVRVASLLNSGADLETVDIYSCTLLHRASWNGHLHTVRLLLQRGVKMDSRDDYGISALIYAAGWGKTEVVVELVKAGANLNLQNTDGISALMGAVSGGKTEVVVELVKAGANLDLQDKDGKCALMEAAYWGKTEIVVELVKAGAKLNLQNTEGDSAVIRATAEQESGALRELVRAGADLNLQNEEGLTALMISVRSGLTDILLTGESIDTDIQENSTGWSALFFSAEMGDVATTESLLEAGASAHLKDKNGLTALEVASASEKGDADGVCAVLRRHMEESATTHSHHALMNLVNSSGLKVKQMFDRLQRRLKSADEKTLFMSGVKGEGRSHVQRRQKRRDQNRPPDKETSSVNK